MKIYQSVFPITIIVENQQDLEDLYHVLLTSYYPGQYCGDRDKKIRDGKKRLYPIYNKVRILLGED